MFSPGEKQGQSLEGGDGMAHLRKNSGRLGCGLQKRRAKKISEEELKNHLMRVKEHSEHEDYGIQFHHQSGQKMGRKWKLVDISFS